jgi:hypothetical protein
MLESFIIEINKMVVVVWVYKVAVFLGKYKARAQVQFGQHGVVRIADVEYFLGIVIQVFTLFVTQVGIGIPIAYNFAWVFNTDSAMIGSDDHSYLFLRQKFKQVK